MWYFFKASLNGRGYCFSSFLLAVLNLGMMAVAMAAILDHENMTHTLLLAHGKLESSWVLVKFLKSPHCSWTV